MMHVAHPDAAPRAWSARYEWRAVTLLSLGFGLVGIDRFMLMPLFPTIMADLSLDYADLGLITGVLAFSWGLAALCLGNLSDRLGHKKVLISALVAFSVLVGLSGLATGVGGLLIVRALMGLADGAYTPVSITANRVGGGLTAHPLSHHLAYVLRTAAVSGHV